MISGWHSPIFQCMMWITASGNHWWLNFWDRDPTVPVTVTGTVTVKLPLCPRSLCLALSELFKYNTTSVHLYGCNFYHRLCPHWGWSRDSRHGGSLRPPPGRSPVSRLGSLPLWQWDSGSPVRDSPGGGARPDDDTSFKERKPWELEGYASESLMNQWWLMNHDEIIIMGSQGIHHAELEVANPGPRHSGVHDHWESLGVLFQYKTRLSYYRNSIFHPDIAWSMLLQLTK